MAVKARSDITLMSGLPRNFILISDRVIRDGSSKFPYGAKSNRKGYFLTGAIL